MAHIVWITTRTSCGDLCEAFAHGRVAQAWRRLGRTPSTAMQLNRLAHGSYAEIAELAAQARRPSIGAHGRSDHAICGEPAWARHERDLAADIVRRAVTPRELRALQRDVLWPLEELLYRGDGVVPEQDLPWLVRSALDER